MQWVGLMAAVVEWSAGTVAVLQPQNLIVEKGDNDWITPGSLLLRYRDERWYSKSFVITYWQIEIISFAKNNFDRKVLGS